jgi:hypothetical protein
MLYEAVNSGDGKSWCGPTVVASITGRDVLWVKRMIKERRQNNGAVKGTHWYELAYALEATGRALYRSQDYQHLKVKDRPTFSQWRRKYRVDRSATYIVGVTGHWVVVQGRWFCDTYSKGKVIRLVDAPHQRRRVTYAFLVK